MAEETLTLGSDFDADKTITLFQTTTIEDSDPFADDFEEGYYY